MEEAARGEDLKHRNKKEEKAEERWKAEAVGRVRYIL